MISRPTRKLNKYVKPMLAKETDKPFDDKHWLYEIKWDGYRAIAEISSDHIELYSRNGNSFAEHYPALVNSLKKIKHNAVLDGEIVVLNEKGFPDFQKIQHYEDNTNFPLIYYVFDLLSLDGHSLYDQPLIERKKLLKKLIGKNPMVQFSDHIMDKGIIFFNSSTQKNLEGIMAKKADSHYYPGKRTNEWLKIKNHKTADVLIAGYTKPTGSRKYFGSLVLAVKNGRAFKHVGHAGTGFDDKKLKEIYELLQSYKQKGSAFKEAIETGAGVSWVKPVLICEVKFTEWTKDEKLRHPVFLRMRNDKSSKEIDMKNVKPVKRIIEKDLAKAADIKVGKATVNITNRDKVYWPKEKITKGMMIDYYQSIASYILPYLKDRPQSLKRNPGGIADKGFYHKDAGENAPSFVKSFKVHSESSNKEIDYIICNDKATLAYLNNLGCIELNPWHSTIKKPDKPDYLIIDIDPSEKNNFNQVIDTANAFKKVLDKAGAKSFCKTSGASGLHIYVPLGKKYSYEQAKDFAHLTCMMVNDVLPDFTTLERNLKKRGNKKIYLDYLQNSKGQTIASVYSLRPKEGATVSMPLLWKEVKHGLKPSDFTIHNALKRIGKTPDIFNGILGPGIDINKCLKALHKES
ncbi:MAG: DNA ligase D [Ferruginibacter sp.]